MTYPYVLLDQNGCGGMAFYMSRMPAPGDPLRSADALTLEGTTPADRIVCGSCRQPVRGITRMLIVPIN